jgi:DNA repair exonuclease SbcCD ATPase subunit
VGEPRSLVETYSLNDIRRDQVLLFVTQRYIDEPTRLALENLLDLRAKIAAQDALIAQADTEIKEIGADQARLRENITALTQTAEARQLIARYVAKADQQETRIEQLTHERQAAIALRAQLHQQLQAAVRAFDITREL